MKAKLAVVAAELVCTAALAGCALAPVDELLASSAIVAELSFESGTTGGFSARSPGTSSRWGS